MLREGFDYIDPSFIHIKRDERQRRDIDVEDLLPSIQRMGILNPLIIDSDLNLVAGERRLTAALKLKLPKVPYRMVEDLSELELQLIELDENIRREDLPWQDKARAMARMLAIYRTDDPNLTIQAFSDHIGYNVNHVHKTLTAAEELSKGNERVANAPTMTKAINVITRENERVTNNVLADILDGFAGETAQPDFHSFDEGADIGTDISTLEGGELVEPKPISRVRPAEHDILNVSFHDWAESYSGPKFNLIHCDFPYGVDLQDSDQAGANRSMYEDSADVYWRLLDTLALAQQNVISSSAHMIFWYSMKFHTETVTFFKAHFPEWTFDELPLIWHKTDNKGIAPDVERRPRRVYETALFGWRGDRKLVKLGSNAYGAPKANSNHVSEKPEPVLRQFLSMVCDSHSRLLDPTCGSGSALRAAESLGASRVLGLELDGEFAEDARAKLKTFRSLRQLSSAK